MAKLPKSAVTTINEKVDSLFDRIKIRFLGPKSVPKKLYVGFKRESSLPGMYENALVDEGGYPDREHLDQLIETASNYLEASRFKAKAKIVQSVQAHLDDVESGMLDEDAFQTKLGGDLAGLFGSLKTDVHRILDTETQRARCVGQFDGISRVAASVGVDDPTIYFVVKLDSETCGECKRLHLLENLKTPRVWKMSEVGAGNHKRGESNPKLQGLHPHCRCSPTVILPSYGFNADGRITYKHDGYDEYTNQHSSS